MLSIIYFLKDKIISLIKNKELEPEDKIEDKIEETNILITMSKEELRKIARYATEANINKFYPHLKKFMDEYEIVGKLRESAFIAQIIHESGSFRYVRELASGKAYEGRKDLGNIYPGDGPKYKGRGLIQITGRSNYTEISKEFNVDFVNNPELLEQPEWATKSACWWWHKRKLNNIADQWDPTNNNDVNFRKITKIINGGYNGYADRKAHYDLALKILK